MPSADTEVGPLVYGFCVRAFAGDQHCGDQVVVEPNGATTVLAVIDGLGHGRRAQEAAQTASATIREAAAVDPVDLLARCHRALRTTRGAAMSIAVVDREQLAWIGVGNVQGVLHRAHPATAVRLVNRSGIVGSRLPQLRSTRIPVSAGDRLVMFTDGVADAAARERTSLRTPSVLARWLLENHATGADDALVLVARCGFERP